MTPSEAVGCLKTIGVSNKMIALQNIFWRIKLSHDRNFHLKTVVLRRWKNADSLLSSGCVRVWMEKFYCVEIFRLTFELFQCLCWADGVFFGQYCLESTEIVEGWTYNCYYEFKTICTELGVERKTVLIINKKFTTKNFPKSRFTIYQKAHGRWYYYGYFLFLLEWNSTITTIAQRRCVVLFTKPVITTNDMEITLETYLSLQNIYPDNSVRRNYF